MARRIAWSDEVDSRSTAQLTLGDPVHQGRSARRRVGLLRLAVSVMGDLCGAGGWWLCFPVKLEVRWEVAGDAMYG